MDTKKALSRITIDLPKIDHKRLKAMSVVTGKSMRQIVVDLITNKLTNYKKKSLKCTHDHKPNKTTIRAIKDAENRKNIKESKSVNELFESLNL